MNWSQKDIALDKGQNGCIHMIGHVLADFTICSISHFLQFMLVFLSIQSTELDYYPDFGKQAKPNISLELMWLAKIRKWLLYVTLVALST